MTEMRGYINEKNYEDSEDLFTGNHVFEAEVVGHMYIPV